jgi:hypothetical protein
VIATKTVIVLVQSQKWNRKGYENCNESQRKITTKAIRSIRRKRLRDKPQSYKQDI